MSAAGRIQGGEPRGAGGARQLRDVVPAFVAAIDAGLFQGPQEGQRARVIGTLTAFHGAQRVDEWEILTPPLDAEAFIVLARMFWSLGTEAVRIAEVLRDKEVAIRTLDQVPRSTVRVPPWRVERLLGDTATNAKVTVCFERSVAPEIIGGTHAVLRAWGALASLGAFPGGEGSPSSAAVRHQFGEEDGREAFATFETLSLGPDAWAPLWTGLRRLHRRALIACVELH